MHALIVGGGVAGAVVGLALRKAGHQCTIHEAFPRGADDAGAFLTIMHNGMDALRAVDAHDVVAATSHPAKSVTVFDSTGRQLQHRDYQGRNGIGPRTLRRSELYRALHGLAARRGCTLLHNKKLTRATTHDDGVQLDFADGTTADGDFAVGADGIHSTTRALINPETPAPRYTGMNVVYGTTEPTGEVTNQYHMYVGPAVFGYTSTSVETLWFARLPGPQIATEHLGRNPEATWLQHIATQFPDDASPARHIIQTTAPQNIVISNGFDVPTTPIWSRGRMMLIGDAAHAASPAAGQGASMALEDSVILAQCVRDFPKLDDAFHAYEAIRRERVEQLVAASADHDRDRGSAHASPSTSRPVTAQPATNPMGWLYDHHIDWSAPIRTPATAADPRAM